MSWTEGTGKTVEEATELALEAAGLSEGDAEIEVLAEASGGRFFGSKAKVRVRPAGEVDEAEDLGGDAGGPDEEAGEQVDVEEKAECAADFLVGLLEAFGLEGTVETRIEDDLVFAEVRGDDLGALIGRQGRTLAAVHEVTRTVVQRRLQTYVRLVVDVEGYREERRQALAKYAVKLAKRVRDEGVEVALEPMNPADRKVIHDAINDEEGVGTYSEGREPKRCVVICPED
ncbi:MAG: hypothetical protein DCC49_09175 [Acidobacteria bacterium]|nr:MAG: hypothetical protein DCC49_09175 [Acidobacteriota bacterium]